MTLKDLDYNTRSSLNQEQINMFIRAEGIEQRRQMNETIANIPPTNCTSFKSIWEIRQERKKKKKKEK